MSNFSFLQSQWPELYQRATRAEKFVITDPRTSLTYSRMALELAVNWMYKNDHDLDLPYDSSLNSLIKSSCFREQFPHKLYKELDLIRKTGNLAIHNKPVSVVDSDQNITNLFYLCKWFAKSYSDGDIQVPGIFNGECIPKEGEAALSKKQLAELQNRFEKDLSKNQEELRQTKERNKQLLDENELQRKQIEDLIKERNKRKDEAAQLDEVQHPRNEYETRKYLIDVSLREAGWDLKGINDKEFKVQYMPKSTNKSETGYVDYVLWDDNGKPLALVEAKKTLESATKGENQAQLYADCLEQMFQQRPVMFYSNGFETFIWNDRFYKQSRAISGFLTKQELQTILFRRTNRKDIRTQEIDTDIAGRGYQMRSIKSIAEHYAGTDKTTGKLIGTNRGALLVLATGTGKTRTAIALSKLMLEANWAKRVLFLADRISLVNQAKRNFVKLMPDHSSVSLLEDKENKNTRIVFSTYQTLMGKIDSSYNGAERFYGVGHFDLIIVDEAHRSIYKKYQAIFDYFDALYLGLTATPLERIDRNTYAVFGLPDKQPTDAFTFEEAVNSSPPYLTPYRSIEVPTKFHTKGIKYNELSEEEKEEFEEEILDGEEATGNEWVDKNALNNWLFNKDTAIKTLNYILKNGIKKRGGDEIGKTIIFARNKKHAQFLKDTLLEIDKELYGNDYAKVITHGEPKAEEFIRRFCDEETERLPQIAISVDMLDTGIDAPSVVNLVFYKPVKSYAKFWQMIGRGSRLRPDLFGPGKHKDKFLIFDLCGNFEFFEENPKGIETSAQKSLTETVFNLKLQLAQYLKDGRLKAIEGLQKYRTQLLDDLHHEICSLDESRFDVKMKIKWVLDYGKSNRELWNHLDKKDIKEIQDHLAHLIKPANNDSDLSRFYDKLLYSLMTKRIESPNVEAFIASYTTPITKVAIISKKLLKKTSIPAVNEKEEIIKLPLEEEYWKTDGLIHLEKIRLGIRDLLRYIDPVDQKYATTNFMDELYEGDVVIKDYEGGESKEKYNSPFKSNIHRLEEIIREHKDNVTIARIRNGESITNEELRSLEKLLYNGQLNKAGLDKELGKGFNLVDLIIHTIGLGEEKVDKAFAQFINSNQLSSVQISFLETIKEFLTKNGEINTEKLYDGPAFKKFHSHGIEGVFTEQQTDVIFNIIEEIQGDKGIG
ncbi:DEAD/DEAH box helicase family protein [Carboxylicivirga sp. N1Y90]|uniref:DEAD/DEAH box helicase family protein n=1 Tax=Carboxylicivirga fragile TaxID=3417571 RepID=UPI003D334384|nr:DEAD/DEAH box helicase family protein [Marinilabiliaceae bacterium N1Y90]